jgi:recombination protein RecT
METSLSIKNNQPTSLRSYLDSDNVKKRFHDVLGDRAPAFMSSIISAVSMNANLQRCNPSTVISSAAIAATLDLPINPSLGFAHIVPYGNNAQFQMGWKGFVQLAMRTGKYSAMNASVVYDGDIKLYNRFTGEMVFNKTDDSNSNKKVVGYLFYFKLVSGFEKYSYMTKGECENHGKRFSKTYSNGPWKTNFDTMALKTVTKQALSKFGILSIEMQKAIVSDQAVLDDNGNVVEYPDNNGSFVNAEMDISEIKNPEDVATDTHETEKITEPAPGKKKRSQSKKKKEPVIEPPTTEEIIVDEETENVIEPPVVEDGDFDLFGD